MRFAAALVLLLGAACSTDPAPLQAPSLPKADPTMFLARILELHRASRRYDRTPGRCRSDAPTSSMIQFRFHLAETRLWTRTYPKEAEAFAFPSSQDPSADPDDRDLAICIVGILAQSGNPRAERWLESIAHGGAAAAAASARSMLGSLDREGRYADLFREAARLGDISATEWLGYRVDDESRKTLEDIAETGDQTQRWLAQRALLRMKWMGDRDWDRRVRVYLSSSRDVEAFRHFGWALHVARSRKLPGLTEILRRRIDEGEAEHRKWCDAVYQGVDFCVPQQAYDCDFTQRFSVGINDHYFDEVLRAYAELGGPLSDLERRRLDFLGYGDNPYRRLLEFVLAWLKE